MENKTVSYKEVRRDVLPRYIRFKRSLSLYDFSWYHYEKSNDSGLKNWCITINVPQLEEDVRRAVGTIDPEFYKIEILYCRIAKPGTPPFRIFYHER